MQNSEAKRQKCSQIKKGRENFTRQKTISSNTCVNGESVNWRSDYHKFKGHTFAQVLKSAVTSASLASKKSRPTCCKAHSHTKNFTNSKVVKVINDGEHNCQTKKPCNPKTGNKVSASVKVSKPANVSKVTNQKMQKTCVPGKIINSRYTDVGSSGVPTYNRYEVLNLNDGVVLRHSDGALTSPQSDCVSSDSAKRHDSSITSKNHTASYYDAMTKTNPTVFSRADPPSEAIGSSAMDTDMQVTTKYDLPLRLKDSPLDYTKIMD